MDRARTQRKEERIVTALPVKLGDAVGITRDVSATGIFFEIEPACPVSSDISFALELDTPTGIMLLKCKGSVLRTEPRENKLGVAVRISESVIEARA